MMRFKKGTKVEVLSKSPLVPSGAWRSAEIISGNGHYYTVMYENNDVTERVPRKTMRPEPPPVQVTDSWVRGDILEVFEGCSWKLAIVSKVLEEDCFLIRLLGSPLKIKANKSDIRVRQSWQDNEWIMIGQGTSRLSAQTSTGKLRRKVNLEGDYILSESKDKLDESDVLSPKGPKKRTYTLVEPNYQTREDEENGRLGRAGYPPKFPKAKEEEKEEEEEDRESVASSVGSCSMDMDGLSSVSFSPLETGNSSDTESSSSCGYGSIKIKKFRVPRKVSEAADVHRLELDEYRCSIERLHASGPIITWEQETWITDLRLRLNISNEEHLMQIKNLISDDNSTTYR